MSKKPKAIKATTRKPTSTKLATRLSSLAAVFVQAIMPRELINPAEQSHLLESLGINPSECAYCGDRKSDNDHFRALVSGARPSGHFHTLDNLLPACGRCNQSKSGQHWEKWIRSKTQHSPTTREIADLEQRIEHIRKFEHHFGNRPGVTIQEMREAVGADLWDSYWDKLQQIKTIMEQAQKDADVIQPKLQGAFVRQRQ